MSRLLSLSLTLVHEQCSLAEAAIHKAEAFSGLFPADWPKSILSSPSSPNDELVSHQWGDGSTPRLPRAGKSLLEIYGLFVSDPQLKPVDYISDTTTDNRLTAAQKEGRAEKLLELAGEWSLSDSELGDGEGGWERKVEELSVLVTLMACATGRQGHAPKVDFFLVRTRFPAS